MESLIHKVISADRKACNLLYNMFNKAMYNTAFRICGNEEDALDVLQETFVSVFKNIKSLENPELLPAWIKKICINTSLKQVERKKKLNYSFLEDQTVLINLNDEDEIVDECQYTQKLDAIQWAVERLPEKYRIVFTLYAVENYSHEQVAELLSIPSATSRSQYMRAKQRIIDLIKNSHYAGSIQEVSAKA
ncbi:MAG: sigma-70 family RNA polymerase sigma factor [Saprospiraceae bacterium]|nr:sigma-70 family RNA polymerase sigma factor [Saprospiraceae bacterium]